MRDDSRILVYFSDGQLTQATRVVFTLDWAGLGDRTMLLDGGLGAWKRAGHEVTAAVPAAPPGEVELVARPARVVDAAWVRSHLGADAYRVLDARSRAFFDGVRESNDRRGHIPGSGSLPWTELVDENLEFHEEDALRQALADAGVRPNDTVVTYCHIGQYATTVLFVSRLLGHDTRLYDGAFQDWAARGLPLTAGTAG